MNTETIRQRIARLEAELQQALIDKDHITYLEASGNLKVELENLERERDRTIDLKVAKCYMGLRNYTKIEMN